MRQAPVQWGVGQTTPQLTIICTKDNKQPVDMTGLVGANLALLLHPATGGSDITGGGTFTIMNALQGVVQYQFVSQDVATAGAYLLYVVATFVTGPYPSDGISFNIIAR